MSVYVMSDIHGEAALFHKMLKQIRFSENDTLYILGDVIDRGPYGIPLLQEIMHTPNMAMLLGNHEQLMLQYYSTHATGFDCLRWSRNGNAKTLESFRKLGLTQQQLILNYLRKLPTHIKINVEGIPYYLVHAFPGDDMETELWKRPDLHERNPLPGTRVIIGHTPVLNLIVPREDRATYIQRLERHREHPHILFASGYIDIDCGCSYQAPMKTLGCLRLNDLAEYYVSTYTTQEAILEKSAV